MGRASLSLEEFYLMEDPGDESAFSGIVTAGGIESEPLFDKLPKRNGMQLYAFGLVAPRRTVDIGKTTGWRYPSSVVWVQLTSIVVSKSLLTVLRPFSSRSGYLVYINALTEEVYAGMAVWGRSSMTSMSR